MCHITLKNLPKDTVTKWRLSDQSSSKKSTHSALNAFGMHIFTYSARRYSLFCLNKQQRLHSCLSCARVAQWILVVQKARNSFKCLFQVFHEEFRTTLCWCPGAPLESCGITHLGMLSCKYSDTQTWAIKEVYLLWSLSTCQYNHVVSTSNGQFYAKIDKIDR